MGLGIAGLAVLFAAFLLTPAESLVTSIPPTRAIADIFTQNTSISTKSYSDFVEMSGIKDIEVRGRPAAHEVIIERHSLSGGEASYFDTTGTTIAIAAASNGSSNMVKVALATVFTGFENFDNGGADDGRIRYTGNYTNTFHVAVTISVASTGPNDSFVYGIAKNGQVLASSKVIQKIASSDTQSTALHVAVSLDKNDYLELYVGNLNDASDAIVKTVNIFALGM